MRVAAIDLGTNTFILLVAETDAEGVRKVLHDEVRVVRLGQDVHRTRRFHPDALARADQCLDTFAETIRKLAPASVKACATSAARDVSNAEDLRALCRRHAIPLEIISGEKEAEFTFTGTFQKPLLEKALIVDIGGGSTELIFGGPEGIVARESLDIGAVRLTEMFVKGHPISEHNMGEMRDHVKNQIVTARSRLSEKATRFVAVAGTPTTLATLDLERPFESERVDGYRLPAAKIGFWVERLSKLTIAERQELAGMEPKRADVIVAGALILLLVAETFGANEFEVSIRGLRYGVARALGKEAQR